MYWLDYSPLYFRPLCSFACSMILGIKNTMRTRIDLDWRHIAPMNDSVLIDNKQSTF